MGLQLPDINRQPPLSVEMYGYKNVNVNFFYLLITLFFFLILPIKKVLQKCINL